MLITILKTSTQTEPDASVKGEAIPFSIYFRNAVQTQESGVISDAGAVNPNNLDYISEFLPDDAAEPPANPISSKFCKAPDFIDGQIPFWIKQNYGTNDTDNYLISFLKEYYNWLYCGFKKQEYKLTPYDLSELLDIDRVPETFLKVYVSTYAPFIKWSSITPENKQNLRKFLKSIKTSFLIAKGTENAYRHLLKELFNITNVNFDYPKKYLTRLNGGKYINIPWQVTNNQIIDLPQNFDPNNPITNDVIANNTGYNTQTRPNLFGSALNESILPDDTFWHDYSYLLTSDANAQDVINYKDTILNGTHPAGTIGFFEQYVNIDDVDIESDAETVIPPANYVELPEIGRYLLVQPGITLGFVGQGNNLYDIYHDSGDPCPLFEMYSCYCCNNYCDPEGGIDLLPQHKFPSDWVLSIRNQLKSKQIANMKIENWVLGLTGDFSSANSGIDTCANFNCAPCV